MTSIGTAVYSYELCKSKKLRYLYVFKLSHEYFRFLLSNFALALCSFNFNIASIGYWVNNYTGGMYRKKKKVLVVNFVDY